MTRAVASTRVLIAIIGSNWLGQRANRPMRIAEPEDWVRREIELALNHSKKIIPVLRDRGGFPKDLPKAIARLRDFNAIIVDGKGEFEHHMTKLIDEITQYQPSRGWRNPSGNRHGKSGGRGGGIDPAR